MKTKGQKLGITDFPYREFDNNGKETYFETSYGSWFKYGYDEHGNRTYFEYNGNWWKSKYDKYGNETYWEDSKDGREYTIR
tara:strand:- start:1795 stop:2037 length:243 start_codon:yes stop_codon:yes gene_type:complete